MCGRYYISDEDAAEDLLRIIGEAVLNGMSPGNGAEPRALKTGGEVFPSDYVPVCEEGEGGACRALGAVWGLPINGTNQLVINARAETAAGKPMFQRARPCIVPATHYFEWEVLRVERPVQLAFDGFEIPLPERVEKRKRSIRPVYKNFSNKDLSNKDFFYMAGLVRHLPNMLPDFTIITVPAAFSIESIHDRMPSILSHERAMEWLAMRKFNHEFIMDSSERELVAV